MNPSHRLTSAVAVATLVGSALIHSIAAWGGNSPSLLEQSSPPWIARQLTPAPGWISSVAASRDQLFLVDPSQKALLVYSTQGELIETVSATTKKLPADSFPTSVALAGSDVVLRLASSDLLRSGNNWESFSKATLTTTRSGIGSGVGSIYEWVLAPWGDLYGYGAISNAPHDVGKALAPGREFRLGLFRLQLAGGEVASPAVLLKEIEDNDWYRVGHRYVAANERGVYGLEMTQGSAPKLFEFVRNERPRELKAVDQLPNQFSRVPTLATKSKGPADTQALFAEIEGKSMVTGIFGQGKSLYVLTRQPGTKPEETDWTLFQIDPASDRIVDRTPLPTTTNHLNIAVGSETWFLIERGRVEGWGNQKIHQVVGIPRTLLEQPSQLRAEVAKLFD